MFVKIVQHFLEHLVLYLSRLAVQHHHAAFIAVSGGILGDFLGWKFELEL